MTDPVYNVPMHPDPLIKYFAGYPPHLTSQVRQLIEQARLAEALLEKYPVAHTVRTDPALYDYVMELKNVHMRNAGPIGKVAFDSGLNVLTQVLGTHTRISRVQGGKLKAKNEIRVASLFRETPPAFLRMIVVHELAHLKEREHDKAFYQLCRHMEPDYAQLEFDVRTYRCLFETTRRSPWA